MGDRVSATTADTVTAPTSVTANSVKRAPVSPVRNMIGRYTATSTIVIAMMGLELARREDRRLPGLHALFQMAVDVLYDDDGVVDDQADREDEGEQRQQVDRVAEREHDRKRAHE